MTVRDASPAQSATAPSVAKPSASDVTAAALPRQEASRLRELSVLALVATQVVVVAVVMNRLGLQSSAVRRMILIAGGGFVVHHFLPARWKLPFFAALSAAALFAFLGGAPSSSYPKLGAALPRWAMIMGVGTALIGICSLPIRFELRIAGLLAVGGAVAVLRGAIETGVLAAALPLLASIFMFRLIVYVYDLRTSGLKPTFLQAFSYFFALPAACATFFPVVDFKKFVTPGTEHRFELYQRGAGWVVLGAVQLVLHRFISQLFFIPEENVKSGVDVLQFVLTNAFLYLKLSGTFHIFVGVLLLFGFNLPATNNNYFLASSFTDYWRRVNIYWKDFILKVFYFPAFFRLKQRGPTFALVVATLWAFFATWALHLYQTWWLKGYAAPTWTDSLFWLTLGLLVLVNSVGEMQSSTAARKKALAASKGARGASALPLMLKTAGTFASICLLWSLWNATSISGWFRLLGKADLTTLVGTLAALAAVMAAKYWMEIVPGRRKAPGKLTQGRAVQLRFAPLLTIAGVFVLIHPAVQARLHQPELQPFRDAVANSDSRIEGAHKDRGYYEAFAHVDTASHDLWEMLMREQLGKPYAGADPVRAVRDYRFREPLPSVSTIAYDTEFRTNSHGMRDREYALSKPAGAFRIALLGSSNVMGWGVRYENTLDAHLERRLNESLAVPGKTFEVLNFAFNGYSPFAQMSALEHKVAEFSPDLVLLVIHLNDYDWMVGDLQHAQQDELPLPDDFVRNALSEARVESRTPRFLAKARLEPARSALLRWVYTHLVSRIRRLGADPVAVTLPISTDAADPRFEDLARRYSGWSAAAGFRILDASSIYKNLQNDRMWKFEHYTAEAHAIIAAMLEERLADHPLVKKAVERRGATEGSQP